MQCCADKLLYQPYRRHRVFLPRPYSEYNIRLEDKGVTAIIVGMMLSIREVSYRGSVLRMPSLSAAGITGV